MRLSAAVLGFVAVTAASDLAGQELQIRSGEHEDFSRLVFTIDPGSDWQLGRDGEGYRLSIGSSLGAVDTAAVFERIPRTRIADLVPSANGTDLSILLGCDCTADAFLYRPDMLVVDVLDEAPDPNSPFETPFPVGDEEASDAVANTTSIRPEPLVTLPVLPGLDFEVGGAAVAEPHATPQQPPAQPMDATAVAQTERQILESLSRGISQGVVSSAAEDADPFGNLVVVAPPSGPDGIPEAFRDNLNVRAETTVERDLANANPPVQQTPVGEVCWPDAEFALASWIDERPFPEQLAERRTGLYSELDGPNEDVIRALARHYVAFGFGYEARSALALIGEEERDAVLAALSYIVDGQIPAENLFQGQYECTSDVALWAILAEEDLGRGFMIDTNVVLRTLTELPEDLQPHIAGRLARRFLEIGDTFTAELVLATTRPVERAALLEYRLAEAELAALSDRPAAAISILQQLAETDARLPPQALVNLVELVLADGRQVDGSLVDLLAVMAFEHRDTAIEADLLGTKARALTGNLQFQEALESLQSSRDRLSREASDRIVSEIAITLADGAADDEFLTLAFSDRFSRVDDPARMALAQRLTELGFADRAWLFAEPVVNGTPQDRKLRAAVLIEQGRTGAAMAEISGLTDDEAQQLRARILDEEGDQRASLLVAHPDERPPDDAAWRAGAWEDLTLSPDPVLSAAAETMTGAGVDEDTTVEPGTLAASSATLQDASDSRDLLDSLFDRFPMPEG